MTGMLAILRQIGDSPRELCHSLFQSNYFDVNSLSPFEIGIRCAMHLLLILSVTFWDQKTIPYPPTQPPEFEQLRYSAPPTRLPPLSFARKIFCFWKHYHFGHHSPQIKRSLGNGTPKIMRITHDFSHCRTG